MVLADMRTEHLSRRHPVVFHKPALSSHDTLSCDLCRSEPGSSGQRDAGGTDIALNGADEDLHESDEEAATDVERLESNRAASTQGMRWFRSGSGRACNLLYVYRYPSID